MKKTLLFTATYNELNNVDQLIIKIKDNCAEANILIVDDNSPDGTRKLLKKNL